VHWLYRILLLRRRYAHDWQRPRGRRDCDEPTVPAIAALPKVESERTPSGAASRPLLYEQPDHIADTN
jgi:hypothetical protein